MAIPTRPELAFLYTWLGSFLVLGTNATIPWVVPVLEGQNLLVYASFLWELIPVLLVLMIGLRVLLIAALKLTALAKDGVVRWTQIAFVTALTGVLVATNLDLMARVKLSEAALRQHVDEAQSWRPHMLSRSHRVGLFTVHHTTISDGVLWMDTVQYGRPWVGGLVYSLDSPPEPYGESDYQHLYGPWWRWRQDI